MPLDIAIDKLGAADVVTLRGRMDSSGAPVFSGALHEIIAAGSRRIFLDCSELRYVSSMGLGVFVECSKILGGSGGSLGFFALTAPVRNVFELSGFLALFPVYSSREEALAS